MALHDLMFELRQSGEFDEALQTFLQHLSPNTAARDLAFRHHFLGGRRNHDLDLPCLLLEGAAHGQFADIPFVNSDPETDRNHFARALFPDETLLNLFASRRRLVQAVSCKGKSEDIRTHLVRSLTLYAEAASCPPASPGESARPGFLRLFESKQWEEMILSVAHDWQESSEGQPINWNDSALLFLGNVLCYLINWKKYPKAITTVESWVLLATTHQFEFRGRPVEIPDGRLARLVIEKVPGQGFLYADGRYSGYLPLGETFQQGLRNVMTVLRRQDDWTKHAGHEFDFRWRLTPLSHEVSHQCESPALLRGVDGPSAEVAFACGIKAALLNERLDPHLVVTAKFQHASISFHNRLAKVGGLSEKMLGLSNQRQESENDSRNSEAVQLRRRSVDTIVLYDPASQHLPERTVEIANGTLRLVHAETFDDAYRLLSEHYRITDKLKRELATRSKMLLETTCSPYVRSSLSRRRPGDLQQEEPAIVIDPLSNQEIDELLTGALSSGKRIRILGESGMGKSTILIEAEHCIAASKSTLVPLRLGAGPASCSIDDQGRWNRLPLLSSFDWKKEPKELLEQLAERLLGDYVPDRMVRNAWIQRAIERNEIVFLFDSLDQSKDSPDLPAFLKHDGVRESIFLLTARPETRQSKIDSYAEISWDTLWMDLFDDERVGLFWGNAPLLDRLLSNPEWEDLRKVPILLHQMKKLALASHPDGSPLLEKLPNREAIYHRTLEMLIQHGQGGLHDSGLEKVNEQSLELIESTLAKIAWETLQLESDHRPDCTGFTGELAGEAYDLFFRQHRDLLQKLDQLNLTTRQTYLDEFGQLQQTFAWRHLSFCEWFTGIHLVTLPPDEQSRFMFEHAHQDHWGWIRSFAFSAAQRQKKLKVVDHLARSLLEAGAPFRLWGNITSNGLQIEEDLDDFCRWLVHRDSDGSEAWENRSENQPPVLTKETVEILAKMFGLGVEEPWRRRDSRWLHPAWQLVRNGLASDDEDVRTTCVRIQQEFLSEYETRVRQAAARNQGRSPEQWRHEDRGLLQLLPDEWRVEFELMGESTFNSIRQWPKEIDNSTGKKLTYEERRNSFNVRLKENQANYCLCPPLGWEHPYRADDGSHRNPHECQVGDWDERRLFTLPEGYELQRTPVTNLQFEAFDALHHRERRMDWQRDYGNDAPALDNHPVIEASWFQAYMMSVWLSGNGTFGTFRLPQEDDWEVCCRAGRDRPEDEFGIPYCDKNLQSILDKSDHERFDAFSSYGANFDGNGPAREAAKGPYREGTIPVGEFQANGFGLSDMHGQVWEWMRSAYVRDIAKDILEYIHAYSDRSVRGGSWYYNAKNTGSSYRFWFEPLYRNDNTGFRLSRTL